VWPEIAPRVYDSSVFLNSDCINGLIVSENYQATREPMHIFLGAVAQIEKHLALRIGFSVSNEEEPCYSVWDFPSCHVEPPKYFSTSPCFYSYA
jgi:hypothetical protein